MGVLRQWPKPAIQLSKSSTAPFVSGTWPANVAPGDIATAAQYNAVVTALASWGGDVQANQSSLVNVAAVGALTTSKVLRLTGIVRHERFTDNQNYIEVNCESLPGKISHSLGNLEIDWNAGGNFYRANVNASNQLEFAASSDGVSWNPAVQMGGAGNVTFPKNLTVTGLATLNGAATAAGVVTANAGIVLKNTSAGVQFLDPTNAFAPFQFISGAGGNINMQYRPNVGTAWANIYSCDPNGNFSFGVNVTLGSLVTGTNYTVTYPGGVQFNDPANAYLTHRIAESGSNLLFSTQASAGAGFNIGFVLWQTGDVTCYKNFTVNQAATITGNLTGNSGNFYLNQGSNQFFIQANGSAASSGWNFKAQSGTGSLIFLSPINFSPASGTVDIWAGGLRILSGLALWMHSPDNSQYASYGFSSGQPVFGSTTGWVQFNCQINPTGITVQGANVSFPPGWQNWTPTLTASSGTITATAWYYNCYLRISSVCICTLRWAFNASAATSFLYVYPPVSGYSPANNYMGVGSAMIESGPSLTSVNVMIRYETDHFVLQQAGNATFPAGSYTMTLFATYRCAS